MSNRWQTRLLPFMMSALIALALFFCAATIWQYGRMTTWMTAPATPPSSAMWTDSAIAPETFDERLKLAQRRGEYALEMEVIRRRYEQNGQAIATRLWARFMGFMTGMIMAIVGSVFILGKLEDTGTEISAKGPVTASIKSASPGLVLAVLGTVLIGMSLAIQVTVSVRDVPVYFGGSAWAAPATPPVPRMLSKDDPDAAPANGTAPSAADALIRRMPPASDGE